MTGSLALEVWSLRVTFWVRPLHLAIYIMQQLITSKQIIFKFIIYNMFKFSGTLLFDSFRFLVHSFVFFYRSLN